MGESWRIGVDTGEVTALVTRGVFRTGRNPIFTGMILAAIGVVGMVPKAAAFAGAALLVLALEIHVRCVEEPHLLAVHGDRSRLCAVRGPVRSALGAMVDGPAPARGHGSIPFDRRRGSGALRRDPPRSAVAECARPAPCLGIRPNIRRLQRTSLDRLLGAESV
ncbi:MAG TPA: methyltransferase [Myxococcota bacterium]|nr:methyltransferase [Myxococcota bacterium]